MARRKNIKGDTVRALMRNDNMAKILRDALNSPIGSTPRKRAQKVVKIMKKIQASNNMLMDGAGGPGFAASRPVGVPIVNKKVIRKNARVYRGAPKMGIKRSGIFDGAGGTGLGIPSTGFGTAQSTSPYITSSPSSNYGLIGNIPNYISGAANLGLNAVGNVNANPMINTLGSAGQFGIQNASAASADALKFLVGAAAPKGPGYVSWGDTWGQKLSDAQNAQQGGALSRSGSVNSPSTGVIPTSWDGTTRNLSSVGTLSSVLNRPSTAQSGAMTNSGTVNTPTPAGGSSFDQGGISQGGSDPFSGYSSASMFAYAMMNDIEKLRSLPGFQDVPPDLLPYGASIGKQLEALYDTLSEETGLNSSMDAIMQSTQTYNDFLQGGVGLNERLTDYIRRRDVYLNKTTGMIDDFKQKIYSGAINTYDPNIAQRATSYLGYLQTLQGRQDKRYVEWLNQSVNVYGQQLQASAQMVQNNMNIYDKRLADFQNRYEQGSKIAIYEYEQLRDLLVETYNTAAGLSTNQLEQQKMQLEIQSMTLDNLKKSLDIEKVTSGINPDAQKALEFLRKQGSLYDQDTGATTAMGRNLFGMIEAYGPRIEMASDGSTYEAGGMADIDTIMTMWNSSLINDFASGQDLNSYFTKAQDYYAGVEAMRNSGNYSQEQQNFLNSQIAGLKLTITQPLIQRAKEKFLSDETLMNALRDATKELSDTGMFGGLKDLPDRDDFLKDYKAQGLPEYLLGQMYDTAQELRSGSEGKTAIANSKALFADSSKYDLATISISKVLNSDLVTQVLYASLFGPTQYQGQGM